MERILLHGGDDVLAVRRESDAEMGALPREVRRLSVGARPPQRDAVVARDREPRAFRRKGNAADGALVIKGALAPIGEAHHRLLAEGEGDGTVRTCGNVIDPFAGTFGKVLDGASSICEGDKAVIASGQQFLAGQRRGKDRAGMDSGFLRSDAGGAANRAVAEREQRRLADEGGFRDERAEREFLDSGHALLPAGTCPYRITPSSSSFSLRHPPA